eukprot:s194_g20.t1
MIVFSDETTSAIKTRVQDPPTTFTPPDGDDPMHPDTHGGVPPEETDEGMHDMPNDPLDDDNQPDYPIGQDPDDDDPHEKYIIPDDHGPPPDDDMDMPGVARDSGETPDQGFTPQPFSNPDVPIDEIVAPDDDYPSPGKDTTSEPIRAQRKQREIAVDSSDALPKAKAKVIIKRPKVQLPGQAQPIEVPIPKDDFSEEDDGPSHDPQASSSNDPSIPVPTTTPTSFMPGEYAQQEPRQNSQGTEELISSHDDDATEPYNTDDTPVLTEEEIAQLQEEDVDTEPYQLDHSRLVEFDGTVLVPSGPKLDAAPDFGSYDGTGFKQFEQYLAKNGKKQPKAESVIRL